jgi:hypothetical protein
MIELLLILACGYFTRAGGDDDLLRSSTIDRGVLCGGTVAYLALDLNFEWSILVFMVFYGIAEKISYSRPWGAIVSDRNIMGGDWSWWEIKGVRDNKYYSMTMRALVGAIVLIPGCYAIGTYWPMLGMFLGFLAAPFLALKLGDNEWIKDNIMTHWNMDKPWKENWNFGETLRGLINGIVSAF